MKWMEVKFQPKPMINFENSVFDKAGKGPMIIGKQNEH